MKNLTIPNLLKDFNIGINEGDVEVSIDDFYATLDTFNINGLLNDEIEEIKSMSIFELMAAIKFSRNLYVNLTCQKIYSEKMAKLKEKHTAAA